MNTDRGLIPSYGAGNTFCEPFVIQRTINLPRQARDKHGKH